MLTNSVLGITQQLVIEKVFPRGEGPSSNQGGVIALTDGQKKENGSKKRDQGAATTGSLRKGKARV
jgi:hypothetical protein